MKGQDDVERAIGSLRSEPDAEADERTLADAMAAMLQAGNRTARGAARPRTMDMVRRHIGGFAVAASAAVVLAGMFAWMTAGPKAPMSAYAALEEAVENSQAAEWVHFVLGSGDSSAETWLSFRPARSAVKTSRGLTYNNARARKTYTYSYAANSMTVSSASKGLDDLDEFGGATSLFEAFASELEELKKSGATVLKSSQVVEGKPYDVYTHDGGSVTVDAAEQRIVRLEKKGSESAVVMDYPSAGPEDIYALGAPRDARVINWGYDEAKALEDEVEAARAGLAPQFFAIVVRQGDVQAESGTAPRNRLNVTVEYRKDRRVRIEKYFEDASALGSEVNREDAASLEAWTRGRALLSIMFYDGHEQNPGTPNTTTICFNKDGTVSAAYKTAYGPRWPSPMDGVEGTTWGDSLYVPRDDVGLTMLPLASKEGRDGILEGVEKTEGARNEDSTPAATRSGWYFNPLRDYAAEERVLVWFGSRPPRPLAASLELPEGFSSGPGDGYEYAHVHKVTEYAQTPAGKWYVKGLATERTGHGLRTREKTKVFLDTTREIPDDVFDLAKFEAEHKVQVK